MKELKLHAGPRTAFGKQLRTLRRSGLLPARIYGPHQAPLPVQLDARAFAEVWRKAGSLSLVDVEVNGSPHTVLIRDVQREATTGRPLHADLFAVAMGEPLRASVPLVFVGEAPAVRQGGTLTRTLDTVEIECLPRNLPHQLEVDVSGLDHMDAGIHVRELSSPKGTTILTPGDELLVKISPPRVAEEVVAPPAAPPEAVPEVAEEVEREA